MPANAAAVSWAAAHVAGAQAVSEQVAAARGAVPVSRLRAGEAVRVWRLRAEAMLVSALPGALARTSPLPPWVATVSRCAA
jgi:hypothetical protein